MCGAEGYVGHVVECLWDVLVCDRGVALTCRCGACVLQCRCGIARFVTSVAVLGMIVVCLVTTLSLRFLPHYHADAVTYY